MCVCWSNKYGYGSKKIVKQIYKNIKGIGGVFLNSK